MILMTKKFKSRKWELWGKDKKNGCPAQAVKKEEMGKRAIGQVLTPPQRHKTRPQLRHEDHGRKGEQTPGVEGAL